MVQHCKHSLDTNTVNVLLYCEEKMCENELMKIYACSITKMIRKVESIVHKTALTLATMIQ